MKENIFVILEGKPVLLGSIEEISDVNLVKTRVQHMCGYSKPLQIVMYRSQHLQDNQPTRTLERSKVRKKELKFSFLLFLYLDFSKRTCTLICT